MARIYDVKVFRNEICEKGYIRLFWEGEKGFGHYDLIIDSNNDQEELPEDYMLRIRGDSEHMDRGEDKRFLESLFQSLIEQVEIIG